MKLYNVDVNDVLDILIFLLLNFLAVAGRLSYDVEIKHQRIKLSSFFNKFFVTTLFTYIIEIFILKSDVLRKYYTQIILLSAFFMLDIISLTLKYKNTIFLYILNLFSKGIKDITEQINKKEK